MVSDSSPRRPPVCIALGRDEAGWRFALDVTGRLPSREETEAQLQQQPPSSSSSSSFESVRALLAVMEPREVAVAGQVRAGRAGRQTGAGLGGLTRGSCMGGGGRRRRS